MSVERSSRDGYWAIAEREGKKYWRVRAEAIANGTNRLPVRRTDGKTCPGFYGDRHVRAQQARELRAAGVKVGAIAELLSCSGRTVQRDLQGRPLDVNRKRQNLYVRSFNVA